MLVRRIRLYQAHAGLGSTYKGLKYNQAAGGQPDEGGRLGSTYKGLKSEAPADVQSLEAAAGQIVPELFRLYL